MVLCGIYQAQHYGDFMGNDLRRLAKVTNFICGWLGQKWVSRVWINNYIPWFVWDVIIFTYISDHNTGKITQLFQNDPNCFVLRRKEVLEVNKKLCFHAFQSIVCLTHWGRDKMATVLQTTLSNAFSSMKMLEFRSRFHWNLFPRV